MRTLLAACALLIVAPLAAQAPPVDPTLAAYADRSGAVAVAPGRRINLVCSGAKASPSAPTVILTGGAGATAASWRRVQPDLAKHARVCAWDRAGFGLSDPSAAPQTAIATTADLLRALAAARIAGPYLLVGHSIGAYETLRFADVRRRDVVGMVLVDPSIPDQFDRFLAVSPLQERADDADLAAGAAELRQCAALMRAGKLPPDSACLRGNPGAPQALVAVLAERNRDPARFDTAASFFESMPVSAKAIVNARRGYGAMPLIVLTAGEPDPLPADASLALRAEQPAARNLWVGAHDDYAALSRRGVNRMVERTGHMMHQQRPDAIVAAIIEMLDQVAAR